MVPHSSGIVAGERVCAVCECHPTKNTGPYNEDGPCGPLEAVIELDDERKGARYNICANCKARAQKSGTVYYR